MCPRLVGSNAFRSAGKSSCYFEVGRANPPSDLLDETRIPHRLAVVDSQALEGNSNTKVLDEANFSPLVEKVCYRLAAIQRGRST